MAHTTSLSFPNMFDVSRNAVSVLEDEASVVNRTPLLMLTEPTELFNSPEFGVGLKNSLFKYNTENERAIIKDKIVDQLDKYEPYVDAKSTQFSDSLVFTDKSHSKYTQEYNTLNLTVAVHCTFSDTDLEVDVVV